MGGIYVNKTYAFSSTTNTALVSDIRASLTQSGWTQSAGTTGIYTSPTGSATSLTVTIPTDITTLSFPNGRLKITLGATGGSGNRPSQDVWLASGNTSSMPSVIHMEISINDSLFFIKLTGPGPGITGAGNATNGSPTTFAMLTTYTPYISGWITDPKECIVAASYYTDPGTSTLSPPASIPYNYHVKYFDPDVSGGSMVNATLLTMKNVWESSNTIFQPPSRLYGGGEISWPYVAVSASRGVIGRINNVVFAAPVAKNVSETTPQKLNILIDGFRYVMTKPHGFPYASTAGSALGQATSIASQTNGSNVSNAEIAISAFSSVFNACGPWTYIMKGDGS
jgi:hypothetical protein